MPEPAGMQGCPKGPLQEEAEVVLGMLWSLRAALEEPARAGGHRDLFRELSLLCRALAGAVPRQRGQIHGETPREEEQQGKAPGSSSCPSRATTVCAGEPGDTTGTQGHSSVVFCPRAMAQK